MRKPLLRAWLVSFAALLLFSLVSLPSARAGEAERKLALELTRLVMPKEAHNAVIDQTVGNLMTSIQQTGAKLSTKDAGKLKSIIREVMPYEELVQFNVDIYASKFTADELKELIKFYNTPVGKKAAKLLPEISGEVGRKVGALLVERLPAALKKAGLQ